MLTGKQRVDGKICPRSSRSDMDTAIVLRDTEKAVGVISHVRERPRSTARAAFGCVNVEKIGPRVGLIAGPDMRAACSRNRQHVWTWLTAQEDQGPGSPSSCFPFSPLFRPTIASTEQSQSSSHWSCRLSFWRACLDNSYSANPLSSLSLG
jgi:hypothetical protein